jgi:CMP-N-acetylneuraminic acid synthetase
MNVGVIYARGRGSSLKKKNIYPLNGKPVLAHFIEEMFRARCLDHIAVWTECAEVADVAREHGAVILNRPREMVHYGAGFSSPNKWSKYVTDQLENVFGHFEHCINMNCNYVLFRAETVDAMMARIEADSTLGFVYAVSPVPANIYVDNCITHSTMPLFPTMPNLFRRIGISISEVHSGRSGSAFHEVSWEEGRDIQHINDLAFAEYIIRKRGSISVKKITTE